MAAMSVNDSDTGRNLARRVPIDRLLVPLETFAHHTLAGAGLLMFATVVAVIWANSPWAELYYDMLHVELAVGIGDATLSKSVHHWMNDGVMSVFFFYVGLEIKRELLVGELSTMRKATLPAIAAVGGMLAPAGIYMLVNAGGAAAHGWGIPMATDIAFALGVLAMLGGRVPIGLKVFLTALAIVDDIGAVVVIAAFYTSQVAFGWLALGVAGLAASTALNRLGVRNSGAYLVIGVVAWLGFLESGVHATIAAILMAFTIPARTRIDGAAFMRRMKRLTKRLESAGIPSDTAMNTNEQQRLFEKMNKNVDQASAPLQRIELGLHGPVTFVVLPLFALANAGVSLGSGIGSELGSPIVLGIVGGLLFGKLGGVTLTAWIAVKLRLADLPEGVTWSQLMATGVLSGIGFTMALFVAGLAFSDPAMIETAKVGILAASIVAGVCGYVWLRVVTRKV